MGKVGPERLMKSPKYKADPVTLQTWQEIGNRGLPSNASLLKWGGVGTRYGRGSRRGKSARISTRTWEH